MSAAEKRREALYAQQGSFGAGASSPNRRWFAVGRPAAAWRWTRPSPPWRNEQARLSATNADHRQRQVTDAERLLDLAAGRFFEKSPIVFQPAEETNNDERSVLWFTVSGQLRRGARVRLFGIVVDQWGDRHRSEQRRDVSLTAG